MTAPLKMKWSLPRWRQDRDIFLWLLLVSVLVTRSEGTPQSFVIEPSDASMVAGTNLVLPCRVENKKGNLQWTRDGFGLGTERDLHGYPRYSMIGSDEEGNFSLQIENIKLEDDAVFQCQVGALEKVKGIRSRNAKLTVYVPPEPPAIVQGSFKQTTAGMNIQLECESRSGKPAASLKWLDSEGNEITTSTVYATEPLSDNKRYNAKLTWSLTPSRKHDGKNFTCKVESPALTEPMTTSILLEVKYPPEVKLTVDKNRIDERDTVRFNCSASANPSDVVYKWYRNDEVAVGDHTTSYVIRHITRDYHKNAISCEVTNSVGSSKKTLSLNVHYGPRFITPPANIPADAGTDVTLKCDVDGNPKPSIIWTFEDSDEVIHTVPEFTILNLDAQRAGRYQCVASVLGYSQIRGTYRVLLKGPPVIRAQRDQFGIEGETVKVECLVVSVPQPTRVIWTHNDREIDVERNARFEIMQDPTEDGVRNILIVHETSDDDFGAYNCTVWNDFGDDIMEIVLHKQTCKPCDSSVDSMNFCNGVNIIIRESLILIIILAAVLGGIAIIVSVTIVIVLCIRRYRKPTGIDRPRCSLNHKPPNKKPVSYILCVKRYRKRPDEDQEPEKQSKTSEQSSNDSDLKVEIRTSSSMSNNGSEPWEENSDDTKRRDSQEVYRYSADYCEPNFPPKVEAHNNNGYIPYVDYQRDYNPPPLNNGRGSVYGPNQMANGIDPRFQAGYANPYLRSSTTNLPPPHSAALGITRPATALPRPASNQYITASQGPVKPGTLATHV